jgi:predicted nucleic acid-binding protein
VAEGRFIVNASPLIFLAAVESLSLLAQLASEVLVPDSVLEEVLAGQEPRPSLATLSSSPWVRVQPSLPVPLEVAGWDLGAGETQVPAVALNLPGAEAGGVVGGGKLSTIGVSECRSAN